tara:strand:+ start:909 stop:2534 length:1626 start_codon:yes stop_codon:yes gene_type:complete
MLLLAFISSLLITILLIPPLTYFSGVFNLYDYPSARKVHATPIPRIGGIAITMAILIPIATLLSINTATIGLILALVCIFILGVLDDIVSLNYRYKFLFQIIATCLVLGMGYIDVADSYYYQADLGRTVCLVALYLFFTLGVTNAINLADGLDGLAGGATLLSFSMMGLLAYESDNSEILIMVLAILGSVFGFLRYNTHPAKVFMGDTGSLLLGFLLGVLSILICHSESNAYVKTLPLLLVGLPVFDTLFVMAYRISQGRSPFHADKNHFHHRLMDNGLKHQQAVLLIYLIQVVFVLLAYFLRYSSELDVMLAFMTISGVCIAVSTIKWSVLGSITHLQYKNTVTFQFLSSWVNKHSVPIYAILSSVLTGYLLLSCYFPDQMNIEIIYILIIISLANGLLLIVRRNREINWLDRLAIHCMCLMTMYFVYQKSIELDHMVLIVHNSMLLIAAVLVLMLVTLHRQRQFAGSTLDFLMISSVIVVLNLPDSPIDVTGVSLVIIKLLVLFYCVEYVLYNLTKNRWLLRVISFSHPIMALALNSMM